MSQGGASGPRVMPGFLAALSFRGFALIWTGAFLSSVGTWIQDVALSWIIHSRMRDPFYLGLRSFAQEAPLLTFMLIGGAVADRIDRRRILLSSQLFQMAMAMVLGLLYATGHLGITAIVLVAFAGWANIRPFSESLGNMIGNLVYWGRYWSLWICLASAIGVSLVGAGTMTVPLLRLRGPMFTMATIAYAEVLRRVAILCSSLGDRNRDLLRLRLLAPRQRDAEDAVLELG